MKKHNIRGSFLLPATILQLFVTLSASADITLIESLDLDQDGHITIKEAVANPALLASFGKIDQNGDGKINLEELAHTKIEFIDDKKSNKTD